MLAEVEYADLASADGNVVDNLVSLRFAEGETVSICVIFSDNVNESVHGKRIMLAGNAKSGFLRMLAAKMLGHNVRLFKQLTRVREQHLAIACKLNALIRADKSDNAHLVFQTMDSQSKARLSDEEFFRRLSDIAAFRNGGEVF